MPIEPSGDTIRARADYRRGKRMWRIADKSDRKAAREGKAADAAKLRGQARRWKRAYKRYWEAQRAHTDADVADEIGKPKEAAKKRRRGYIAEAAADMWGRSADALRMAHEADTKADEAQDPKDARRKKADAKAMRDLAEAWQTAGRAFDDALAKRKIADSPPGPLQGPDPAKKKEAEIALAAARGLWEAAAILLDAEEVRRGAVEAKEAGDKKAGRILDGVRRELLKAAEAWKKAAAAAGEGKEKARLAHEKAAKNHYRAAGALEEERDEEDIPGKQPKPKGQKSSGLFKKAAEAWEEIALARKAAPGAIVAANALTAAARATSASDAAWAEGHDVAGDAWGRAACCWLAISGKQASNPGLVEALSLGAGLWEKAGEALSVGEKFGAPYLKTARSYPSTESLVEAAKATGPSKPLDRQQSKRERK